MEKPDQLALINCLRIARDAGVPQDQASKFITLGYVPLPWQWEFHAAAREADLDNGPVDIGVGGARGPGKSHAVLAQSGLDDCQRVPRLKGLFLRQTGVAAKESFDDLIGKVLFGKVAYKRATNVLRFPNGSRIVLGGFRTENDIDKFIGIEYDFIIVEELNQLTESKYTKLRGSLRTSKPNWRPRMYTSFNPGGIGHDHVKTRYVIPYREGTEKETRFIGSTYLDNPYLNKEYIQFLESLTGDLGKAWREGEWDIFAGMFFKEFRTALHICKPFIPSKQNILVGGLDWGYNAPFCFSLSEVSRIVLQAGIKFYRVKTFLECYGTEKTPPEWAEIIKDRLKFFNLTLENIAWIQADPATFNKGTDGSISIRDQFIKADDRFHNLKPGSNDRIAGWAQFHNWLSIAPDGLPYWQISENCINGIKEITSAIYDENKIEDLGSDLDHFLDQERYKLKALKWLDAGKIGGIAQSGSNQTKIPRAPQFIGEKQLSINLNTFAEPKTTSGSIGGVRH